MEGDATRRDQQVDARTLPLSLGLQEPLFLFADAMMKALRCNVGRCVSDLHFPSSAQEAGRKAEQVFR